MRTDSTIGWRVARVAFRVFFAYLKRPGIKVKNRTVRGDLRVYRNGDSGCSRLEFHLGLCTGSCLRRANVLGASEAGWESVVCAPRVPFTLHVGSRPKTDRRLSGSIPTTTESPCCSARELAFDATIVALNTWLTKGCGSDPAARHSKDGAKAVNSADPLRKSSIAVLLSRLGPRLDLLESRSMQIARNVPCCGDRELHDQFDVAFDRRAPSETESGQQDGY
jgi:hypothetical protein